MGRTQLRLLLHEVTCGVRSSRRKGSRRWQPLAVLPGSATLGRAQGSSLLSSSAGCPACSQSSRVLGELVVLAPAPW